MLHICKASFRKFRLIIYKQAQLGNDTRSDIYNGWGGGIRTQGNKFNFTLFGVCASLSSKIGRPLSSVNEATTDVYGVLISCINTQSKLCLLRRLTKCVSIAS